MFSCDSLSARQHADLWMQKGKQAVRETNKETDRRTDKVTRRRTAKETDRDR